MYMICCISGKFQNMSTSVIKNVNNGVSCSVFNLCRQLCACGIVPVKRDLMYVYVNKFFKLILEV